MLVPSVVGMTLHFKSGKTLHFSEGEFSLNLCQTVQQDADGSNAVPVEYYMVTTIMEERFIANAGTGELEGQELGHLD